MGIHSRVTEPRATIIFNTVNFHHKDGLIPQPDASCVLLAQAL